MIDFVFYLQSILSICKFNYQSNAQDTYPSCIGAVIIKIIGKDRDKVGPMFHPLPGHVETYPG